MWDYEYQVRRVSMFYDRMSDSKASLLMIMLHGKFMLNQLEKKWFKTKKDKQLILDIKACIHWTEQRSETI